MKSINSQPLHFVPSLFSFFPLSGSLIESDQFRCLSKLVRSLIMFASEEEVQFHCPVLETGLTPSDIQELLSLFELPTTPSSGLEESNRSSYSADERKRRRMISNRESARRSRWRKKRHIEDLTHQVNQLKVVNHDLKNRLGSTLGQCHVLLRDNDRLRSESVALQARLWDLYQYLVSMQSCQ